MNTQIQKVTYYIETHLDDELELEQLAKVAGYSPYHFCRIFKIHIGESALSYARRLKLERAAREMVQKEKNLIDIALDAGYKTPTGFLKAFKSRFGMTSTNYRIEAHIVHNKYKEIKMNTPQIITREDTLVVFIRELGEYGKSSQIAWEKLTKKFSTLIEKFEQRAPKTPMNISPEIGEAFGICYDDPKVTDEKNIRYEAAKSWNKEDIKELENYDFETKTIAGGRYAKAFYKGESNGEDIWYALYAWIEENGYECRNEPAFEKYLNGSTQIDLEELEVEVHVPIQ